LDFLQLGLYPTWILSDLDLDFIQLGFSPSQLGLSPSQPGQNPSPPIFDNHGLKCGRDFMLRESSNSNGKILIKKYLIKSNMLKTIANFVCS